MREPWRNDDPWVPDDGPWTPDGEGREDQEQRTAIAELLERLWCVILYNDDWHTFDEVILQLQKATGCSQQHGERIAHEVHTQGRAVAYRGVKDRCRRVAGVLREIRLQAEVDEA